MKKFPLFISCLLVLTGLIPADVAAAPAPAAKDQSAIFVERWLAAWNSHDLEAILAEYTDDFKFTSPLVKRIRGIDSGTLQGKAAIGDYWRVVLEKYPDLRLAPIAVTRGINSLSIYYTAHTGGRTVQAIETFFFNPEGLVYKSVFTMD